MEIGGTITFKKLWKLYNSYGKLPVMVFSFCDLGGYIIAK